MNKKIIGIAIALCAVIGIGAYFASQSFEAEVEEFIRSEIAKTPIQVEDIAFSATSGTLTLTNISFEDTVGQVASVLKIDSAKLEGFNEKILDPDSNDFSVFEDLYLTNISYHASIEDAPFAESKVDAIHVKNYKQDIMTLWEEMKKDNTSEAFYTAVLSHAYDQVSIKNYSITMFDPFVPEKQVMTFEEIVSDATNFMDWDKYPHGMPCSVTSKNIKIESSEMDMIVEKMDMKDCLIPHPTLYTLLINNAYDLLAQTSPLMTDEDFQEKVLEYVLGETAIFERMTMEGISILPKDAEVKEVLGDKMTLEKMSIELEAGENLSASLLLDKFVLNAQLIYPELDPNYVPIASAFIGDTLSFDFYTKHALTKSSNEYAVKTEARIANLAGASVEAVALADLQGSPLEDIAKLIVGYENLKYKKIALSYEDLGLLPLIGQIAVKETRLPLEALLPLATAEIQNFSKDLENEMANEKSQIVAGMSTKSEEDFAREEKMFVAIQKIADMLIKMLEKPGSFTAELVCAEPMTAEAIGEQIISLPFKAGQDYQDIEFKLDVKQGEKTFKEATPQALLAK